MICKKWLFLALLVSIIFSAANAATHIDQRKVLSNSFSTSNPADLRAAGEKLQQISDQTEKAMIQSVSNSVLEKQLMADMFKDVTPELLMSEFCRSFMSADNQEILFAEKRHSETINNVDDSYDGLITGHVTVNSLPPQEEVLVLAFDEYGYYAGYATVNSETGVYVLTNLKPGNYYVATWSRFYVDEIYNNIQAPLSSKESWRLATLVSVGDLIPSEINIDLQNGAVLSGKVMKTNGVNLVDSKVAVFSITRANSPAPILTTEVTLNEGLFDNLIIPETGDFKILAVTDGYIPTWYADKTTWETAQVVHVESLDTPLQNINFTMQPDPDAANKGSISGDVRPEGVAGIFPSAFALIYAYNKVDTSFAGLAMAILGSYKIENLEPGDYYVYADDYLADFLGAGNYLGEFYNGVHTIANAAPVKVEAGKETKDIKFTLESAGSISGKAVNSTGTALDSLLIVAVNANMLNDSDEPFLTQLYAAIAMTDKKGEYKLQGLPTGEYVIRTVSSLAVNIDLSALLDNPDDLSSLITRGKHSGAVVDEYYQNVYHLLDFEQANRVAVTAPNETKNINIELSNGTYFTGKITDAQSGDVITNLLIVALNDTSAIPYLSFGVIQIDGSYKLGPLPQRKYKILALPGFNGESPYLAEYYNNTRSFYDATVLELGVSDFENVNFELEKGAIIQGYVDLIPGEGDFSAGADTLNTVPVIVYDALNGEMVNFDYMQFNGGYRIDNLLPGSYRVQALPMFSSYSSSFVGGKTFNDPATTTINLNYGQEYVGNIELTTAPGNITGHIKDMQTSLPLSGVGVIAYDQFGFAAGFTLTGYDASSGLILENNGDFVLSSLEDGSYYLRTFSLTKMSDLLGIFTSLFDPATGSFNLAGLLNGGLNLNIDLTIYQNLWYVDTPALIDLNLEKLLFRASAYGMPSQYEASLLPFYFPIPFSSHVPGTAQLVTVSGGHSEPVEFALSLAGITDLFTGVQENENPAIPLVFDLFQNYPNPFNPHTRLTFTLPERDNVTLAVYDALGRLVTTIINAQTRQAGSYSVSWNGLDNRGMQAASGIYFARLQTSGFSKILKMTLLR